MGSFHIGERLHYLRNVQGPADRTLIYLTFYITECLRKLQRVRRGQYVARIHRVAGKAPMTH